MRVVVYDAEIIKCIPPKKGEVKSPDLEYCDGWRDFENMGISCICAYDSFEKRYRVFLKDNFPIFQALIDNSDLLVGFNNIPFDNNLLRANGIHINDDKCYDLLREQWRAAGLGDEFRYPSHVGFSLDATAKANLQEAKTGSGALAPIQWQRGNYGDVIDYCLMDVTLTSRLFALVRLEGELVDPRDGSVRLKMAAPIPEAALAGK